MAHRQSTAYNGSAGFNVRALILILLPVLLILLLNVVWFTIEPMKIKSKMSCILLTFITTRPFLMTFLNFPNTSSKAPVYTLTQTYPYEHRLTTPKGINYYVKSKFEQYYPVDSLERVTIEERVERDYFGIIRQNCQLELQRISDASGDISKKCLTAICFRSLIWSLIYEFETRF
ncbi:chaperone protein dnaJ 49-like [Trifolium medium]|uniref:Chaperone protein dnaJ 49-like n=1 Tax=Trifolium medium TaxID=97028 RepID=A0A392N5N5_9FABA|nr:chaperone protein dnaJ 49-like [Trifolium medium]